jgi:predicted esterase
MAEHLVSLNYKARYFTLGELNDQTREVWFVLHGQGQLAKFFIQKFKAFITHHIYVIAPEGLSHHYLDNMDGRVGATWMTKENRQTDIENYITYLNKVLKAELPDQTKYNVTVLGFSQGAATASRWIMDGKLNFKRLILWGGMFAHDIGFEKGQEILRGKDIILAYGRQDPFLTDERFAEFNTISAKLNVMPTEITFEGAHELHEPTLLNFITPGD